MRKNLNELHVKMQASSELPILIFKQYSFSYPEEIILYTILKTILQKLAIIGFQEHKDTQQNS